MVAVLEMVLNVNEKELQIKEMEATDDIDILLTLHPHGWSTCFISIKGKTFTCLITHVFGDPYADLMLALTDLINGQKSAVFFWYDEPGGNRISIGQVKEMRSRVVVSIDSFGRAPSEYDPVVSFELTLRQLITLFYLQLKKTSLLLLEKRYAENRTSDFPFQPFHKFERAVNVYLNL